MTRRTQRVGEAMREALSELIQRQVKDPRVGFVTVTAVRVTPDLSKAHVYYTSLDAGADTQAGLESAAPFLRSETGRRVRLKTLPELIFHRDDTSEKAGRIDEIIHDIHARDVVLPPLEAEVDAALTRAADELAKAGAVACAAHIGPDGDALGSMLAVALALGPKVTISFDLDPLVVPAQYDFMPGLDRFAQNDDFVVDDVAFAVDCASAERLGVLQERMERARLVINLDHHVSNTMFGHINVVDDQAPSSSELVLRLLERMAVPVTSDVATCLYVGLVTDTGRFSYANATPRAHLAAAYLVNHGVAPDVVAQAIFERHPYGYVRTLGIVLARSRLLRDPDVVLSHLTQADLAETGVSLDETDELIDGLRATRDADVALIFKELESGAWKGSLRSKGGTDVGAVAQSFGGGGHKLAAGFTVEGPLENAIASVIEALGGPGR